ncbi:hypothetical protein AYI69_g9589, partial [Smittium culicis]
MPDRPISISPYRS